MAHRPIKLCAKPGCNELTRGKYCEDHEREDLDRNNANDKDRRSASKRGYDRTWQKARLMYLRRNPLCAKCRTHLDLQVHHKVPISEGGSRLDPKNLETLCGTCHKKHHAGRR
jgi:5-methylcytosine-specific restriction protein A